MKNAWERPLLLAILVATLLAAAGCVELEPTPREVARARQPLPAAPQYVPVKGAEAALREATVWVEPLPVAGGRFEVRTLVVRPGEGAVLVPEHEVALELLVGDLATVGEGGKQVRQAGESWLVAPGERVKLEVHGELAVLRAIYLITGPGKP